jgi:predicted glycosyltransferase
LATSKEGHHEGGGREAQNGSPRILLYSHDSWGLGHLRRNLTIAAALSRRFPAASILIVTGSPCATQFPLPPNVSLVKLPSVSKDITGSYCSNNANSTLDFVVRLRSGLLLEAFRSFRPHLLIVDHKVIGLKGELVGVLREARRRGVKTVLGLRDIIDSPEVVRRRWANPICRWALRRAYDRICVYGSSEVFDPRVEYPLLGSVAERVSFSGYIVRPCPATVVQTNGQRPRVLVTMGGGQDGAARIRTYLKALALSPPKWRTSVLTGPLMEVEKVKDIKRLARRLPSVEVHRFYPDLPKRLGQASLVVTMAGYNTSAEILQSGRPAIFLPRSFPRKEQLLRAGRLARLGLAYSLPDPSPERLREVVERALGRTWSRAKAPRLDGTRNLCDLVEGLLDAREPMQQPPRSQVCQQVLPTF